MKKEITAALANTGAVIGAGFASGREIAAFFSRYGVHSWWLIILACAFMTLLCRLCMRLNAGSGEWTALFGKKAGAASLVSCVLMVLTAGAMIAAAGHLTALVWNSRCAYVIGAASALVLAWQTGRRGLGIMGWLSAMLSMLLMAVIVYGLRLPASQHMVQLAKRPPLTAAAIGVAAYASMNIMLAVGVICRSRGRWTPWLFGLFMLVLLGTSNALYVRHPELLAAPFPIVALLQAGGQTGFMISTALLYLAVFTTLSAVLCALRSAVQTWLSVPWLRAAAAVGLPAAVSCMGFTGIVDRLYTPAGIVCLLGIWLPLAWKNKQKLDFW